MLSRRNVEYIAEVCGLKKPNIMFGGIQVILCGDFKQLSPVPYSLLHDQGEYCFNSHHFKGFHFIFLNEVKRQQELELIKCVEEVTSGQLSVETINFIRSLNRPLIDENSV